MRLIIVVIVTDHHFKNDHATFYICYREIFDKYETCCNHYSYHCFFWQLTSILDMMMCLMIHVVAVFYLLQIASSFDSDLEKVYTETLGFKDEYVILFNSVIRFCFLLSSILNDFLCSMSSLNLLTEGHAHMTLSLFSLSHKWSFAL